MTLDLDDTIAAIASAPGGALRGIVRLSGPESLACVSRIVERPVGGSLAKMKTAACLRATIHLGSVLGAVPVTLYVWPTSSSYTRQPSAELHLPGSPPLVEAALRAVCEAGARLARPGEFTLRAFLAGRLDLTQAEAVLGVIEAESARELDAALEQLAGGLARPLQALRQNLLDLVAHLEAGLDFAHEDLAFITPADLAQQLAAAEQAVSQIADQMQARDASVRLPRVVLTGLPNAGKSSLLNALAGEPVSIVSEVAGTTRDFVSRRVSFFGTECLLIDTAGQAPSARGELERAAQRIAEDQSQQADLTIACLDASRPLDQAAFAEAAEGIIVWTKCDLPRAAASGGLVPEAIFTSSRTGQGLDELRNAIVRGQLASSPHDAGVVAGTADRCRDSLRRTAEALAAARSLAAAGQGEELVASELRLALDELGRIVGAIYTEDLLDRIFSRFCIGK